jgi:membrane protein implicated in regulation of membrane protease activity
VVANPLRSEAAAFHWVLGTAAVLSLLVAASWIATWLGIVAAVILAGLAAWWFLAALRRRPQPPPPERADVEDTPER